jgi:hypothetical protein
LVERASRLSMSNRDTLADAGRVWRLFLVTGTLWLLFSIIVFRFDYTTVSAISILFGILMLAAAVMEMASVLLTHGLRRIGHGGFWGAGNFGHKVILRVIWVGAAALTRGISEIVFAFSLRHMRSEA